MSRERGASLMTDSEIRGARRNARVLRIVFHVFWRLAALTWLLGYGAAVQYNMQELYPFAALFTAIAIYGFIHYRLILFRLGRRLKRDARTMIEMDLERLSGKRPARHREQPKPYEEI